MECPYYEWISGGFLGEDRYHCDKCGDVSEPYHNQYCRGNWSECSVYKNA